MSAENPSFEFVNVAEDPYIRLVKAYDAEGKDGLAAVDQAIIEEEKSKLTPEQIRRLGIIQED